MISDTFVEASFDFNFGSITSLTPIKPLVYLKLGTVDDDTGLNARHGDKVDLSAHQVETYLLLFIEKFHQSRKWANTLNESHALKRLGASESFLSHSQLLFFCCSSWFGNFILTSSRAFGQTSILTFFRN